MIANFLFSFLVSPHFIARTAAPQPAALPRSMGHHALSLAAPNWSLVQHTPLWPPKNSCFTFDRRPETALVLLSCTKSSPPPCVVQEKILSASVRAAVTDS
ncbi:hypothetical protein HDK64DRAFT_262356 [Phyllosticta capitalensis]